MEPQFARAAFSIDEAAARAGVGRDKIYDAVRSQKLKAKKDGRRTLILAEELTRYLTELPDLQLDAGADA